MNKLKKIFSPRVLIIFFSAALFVFSLSFVNKPSQSETQGIVTSMAVDYAEEQVELACSVVTPTSSLNSKSTLYSAKADTIAEAVELIGMQLGKSLGFAQCDVVAVGSGLVEQGIVRALDYFTRTKKVGKNVLLVGFEGKAKEIIESFIYLEENLSLQIPQILKYNKEFILAVDSNLENFYLGYYGDSGISIMPKVSMKEENTSGGIEVTLTETSPSDLGAQGGDGSEQEQKKLYFVNDGKTTVLRRGVKVMDIEPYQIKKLNLFLSDAKYGTFKVKGVEDDIYKNADVVMRLEDKTSVLKYRFKDGTPILELNLTLYLQVEEIIETEKNKKLLRREDELMTDAVVKKLSEKLNRNLNEAVELMKTNNIDLLQLSGMFNKFHYGKWEKYKSKPENQENPLQNIKFEWDINIAQYL